MDQSAPNYVDLAVWKQACLTDGPVDDDVVLAKACSGEIKSIDVDARSFDITVSTEARDRDRDTISVKGWDLSHYKKNPVVLWAHDYTQPPVGKSATIKKSDGALVATPKFAPREIYPFADTVFQLYAGGYMKAASVGFRPQEWTINDDERGFDFSRTELLEWSAVPVPSNPEALVGAKSAGIDISPIREWAERVMDGEADGLWLPRSVVERAWRLSDEKGRVLHLPASMMAEEARESVESLMDLTGATSAKFDATGYVTNNDITISDNAAGWDTITIGTTEVGVKKEIEDAVADETVVETPEPEAVETPADEPVEEEVIESSADEPTETEPESEATEVDNEGESLTTETEEPVTVETHAVEFEVPAIEDVAELKAWLVEHAGKLAEGALAEPRAEKTVISYRSAHSGGTPLADRDESWDGPGEVAAAEVDDLKVMSTALVGDPDLKGSYKLPHHKATGEHAVVWRGVSAAAGRLGQTTLDDGDLGGVQEHLGKHYAEFDEAPPWERSAAAWSAYMDGAKAICRKHYGDAEEMDRLGALLRALGFEDEADAFRAVYGVDEKQDEVDEIADLLAALEQEKTATEEDDLLAILMDDGAGDIVKAALGHEARQALVSKTGRLPD
jgi:HK97 family phage prohead protease